METKSQNSLVINNSYIEGVVEVLKSGGGFAEEGKRILLGSVDLQLFST